MPTQTRITYQRKIIDLPALLVHRRAAREAGKTVVHCHGCFDIVHPGHIRYLQFAKQQGDVLVVSLTGDPHVGKGEGRPYVPQELRAENLAALEFVDHVYINPTTTAVELLSALKPDVYIKGREYEHNQHPGFLKERHAVEAAGGRVIFSSGDVIYSSSHIIENYARNLDLEEEKLGLFCKRYDVGRGPLLGLMDAVLDRPFVVLGDTVLDRYQYCDATDLSGDGPAISLVPLEARDYLGGSAIIARHLAELGARVTLIASFGRDDASDAAIDSLEAGGVDVQPMRNRKKLATKTRFVVDTQKMFQLDDATATPTDSANEKWLLEKVRKLADPAAALIMYDAGLGAIIDTVAAETLAVAQGTFGKTIGATAGSRGRLTRFTGADLLVSNERGLRSAMRDYEKGVSALACALLAETRGKAVAMPLGKKGLMCFDEHVALRSREAAWEGGLRSEYIASPINGPLMDRLGADEALVAVAGAILGAGGNVQQASYIGLLASVLETRKMGQTPVDAMELRRLVETRPELG